MFDRLLRHFMIPAISGISACCPFVCPLTEPTPQESVFVSKLDQHYLQTGLVGGDYFQIALRKELTAIAATGGAQAVKDELAQSGAVCSERSERHQCQIEKSITYRNMDIFFPKYQKRIWHVSINYDQRGNAVANIDVSVRTEGVNLP